MLAIFDFEYFEALSKKVKIITTVSLVIVFELLRYFLREHENPIVENDYATPMALLVVFVGSFFIRKMKFLESLFNSLYLYVIALVRASILAVLASIVFFIVQLLLIKIFGLNYSQVAFFDGKLKWIVGIYLVAQAAVYCSKKRSLKTIWFR